MHGRVHQHLGHVFHELQGTIEVTVLSPLLDNPAGMSSRSPVPPEQLTGLSEVEPAAHVGKVHGDLASDGHLCATTRRQSDQFKIDVEDAGDRFLQQ